MILSSPHHRDSSGENENDVLADDLVPSVLDLCHMIRGGSFLPAALLLDTKKIEPDKCIADVNTGATVAHYAAHHGNLKFIRWYFQKYGASHCA